MFCSYLEEDDEDEEDNKGAVLSLLAGKHPRYTNCDSPCGSDRP